MLKLINQPKFREEQQVQFVGGSGTISYKQSDGGQWLYGVEMPLGAEPDMGRIGYETIVLIPESELSVWQNSEKN
ncbi:MAG: hypothetical protein AAGA16_21590 [Cyanobacteria bacterium P01_E01_bin.35]